MLKQRKHHAWPAVLGPNTPINRREVIGRACWTALRDRDPAEADRIRRMAAAVGDEAWLVGVEAADEPGEWLTREQVAARAGVSVDAVRMWGSRGLRLTADGSKLRLVAHAGLYHPDHVDEFLKLRDTAVPADHPRP